MLQIELKREHRVAGVAHPAGSLPAINKSSSLRQHIRDATVDASSCSMASSASTVRQLWHGLHALLQAAAQCNEYFVLRVPAHVLLSH
eukprot:4693103-Alexandrium_andersonii.AAC.1